MSESGWRRYRSIWRPRVQQDVDDEMEFHLRMRVDEFVAAGMPRGDAERVARERYGNVAEFRSTLVDMTRRRRRHVDWRERFHDIAQSLRISLRAFRRVPRFALGVVATLGLGIAANATMFSVVDRLLLRGPAGIVAPDQVRRLYVSTVGPQGGVQTVSWFGYISYTTLRDRTTAFSGVGAYESPGQSSLGSGTALRLVPTAHASWDLFPTLGVHAEIGRFFNKAEDTPNETAHVAVISDGLWQDDFGRNPSVLGSAITVDRKQYTVVGVAPAGFNGPERSRTDIWLPITLLHPCSNWTTVLTCEWLQVVTRLAPGVTSAQADAEATRVLRAAFAAGEAPWRTQRDMVRPLWYGANGAPSSVVRVSEWLMGVSLIVLLITCVNVANLLLARARRRRREIAVRVAIGAGTRRLVALVLSESLLLCAAGAALAVALSWGGGRVMQRTLLAGVTLPGSVVDVRVFAFTLAIALCVAVAIGLISAVAALRVNVTAGLRESASAGGGQRHRVRATLSGVQAALSVVLLIGAGLFELSLYRSEHVPLGFDAKPVLQAEFVVPDAPPPAAGAVTDWEQRQRETNQLLVRTASAIAREPWVQHAAIAVGLPFGDSFGVDLKVPGLDSIPQLKDGGPYINAVTSDYFAAVGTPLLRGRLFRPDERDGTPPVTIVDETMARLLWPGQDPLTKCLIIGDPKASPPCAAVVGVVADAHRNNIEESPTMQYYLPLGQERGIGGPVVLIRTRGDARQEIDRARKELSSISGVQDVRVKWMASELDPEYAPYRLGALMFGIFGGLALIIAAVGLYSVIAYLVTDRTREIGVRLALGAGARRVAADIVASGGAMTGLGILVGLVVSVVAAGYVQPLLFHVHTPNWPVFAGASALMLMIALLATWVPARRASRVDPVIALRSD